MCVCIYRLLHDTNVIFDEVSLHFVPEIHPKSLLLDQDRIIQIFGIKGIPVLLKSFEKHILIQIKTKTGLGDLI